ncbi:hypothetical protein [Streptomyces sp. NBRC 110028]|uniref:hypothetical protein n=1 Tax=Streptomyces sp. NBRC 110028 TaxID=1621260 RepID=UPI0006E3E60A|nr:hypothetical protein [Streptomyces sp. NBRC 110028]
MVIDPTARRTDGESVRIAKDVLCAGAQTKICLPDGPEEVERALARRGGRRPVVVGDDRALLRVVEMLHRQRELADAALSVVPVGGAAAVALAHALGVPTDAVAAARTVLDGAASPRDLLVDESGGVVLGGLRIPGDGAAGTAPPGPAGPYGPAGAPGTGPGGADGGVSGGGAGGEAAGGCDCGCDPYAGDPGAAGPGGGSGPGGEAGPGRTGGCAADGHHPWWTPAARTARTALTLLSLPVTGLGAGGRGRRAQPPPQRLRVEADGVLLTDLDRRVEGVSVSTAAPGGGLAEVVVHPHAGDGAEEPVRARARAVTVSGQDFRYHSDALVRGPVRSRTWTVLAGAWNLTLPHHR